MSVTAPFTTGAGLDPAPPSGEGACPPPQTQDRMDGYVSDEGDTFDLVGRPATSEQAAALDQELAALNFTGKKKKKKRKKKKVIVVIDDTDTYPALLSRIYSIIRAKNPDLNTRKRYLLPPPKVGFIGSRKTMWSNFGQITDIMHRTHYHVMSFFLTELATSGTLDSKDRFTLRGRFRPKAFEGLLKKYIVTYVTCLGCRSPDTLLTRDPMTRLHFLGCNVCHARRAVAPIQKAFVATSRTMRRATRT